MIKTILVTITVIFLTGCVVAPPAGKIQLDRKHFSNTITIYDQPTTVTFSTFKGLQTTHGSHNILIKDNFLRGFLDKNTGTKSYQVYNLIVSAGLKNPNGWKRFEQVNFSTLTGKKFIPTTIIKRQEDCSAFPTYARCLYSEHITFRLDEALVRAIASTYTPRTPMESLWQYVLIPKSGNNYLDKISVAEIAGLLEEMDNYIMPIPKSKNVNVNLNTMFEPHSMPEPLIQPARAMIMLPLL